MKYFTIFGLLVYWSIIISAPVVSNEIKLDKLSKSISHLVEAQMPLNVKQLERLGLAFKNKAEPVGVVT